MSRRNRQEARINSGTRSLVELAMKGDKASLLKLEQMTNGHPEVWEEWGDLARSAQQTLVGVCAGDDAILKWSIESHLTKLRRELGGPAASPLECLLVDRVAACWLQVNYFEMMYAWNVTDIDPKQLDYYQKRIDRAHRRFLASCKTLAQVRRLLVPAFQINVGAQQVNRVG